MLGLGINGEGEGVASFVVVLRDFNGWILGYVEKDNIWKAPSKAVWLGKCGRFTVPPFQLKSQ